MIFRIGCGTEGSTDTTVEIPETSDETSDANVGTADAECTVEVSTLEAYSGQKSVTLYGKPFEYSEE